MAQLLQARKMGRYLGTRMLFRGVDLVIGDGERMGLIGPNGAGKSTLLRMLAGLEPPDEGELIVRRGLKVGYVAQVDRFSEGATVLSATIGDVEGSLGGDEAQHEREIRAQVVLGRMGFETVDQQVEELSGGWRKRLAIARVLVDEPDLLLLDEPTNHLDLEGIEWLEGFVGQVPMALVVVTHDRYFLECATNRVVELSAAYPDGTFEVEGSYSKFLERREEFLESQSRQEQAVANQVRADIAWLRRGVKARRTRSRSRVQDSEQRQALLGELRRRNAPAEAAGIEFSATGRKTRILVQAKGLSKGFEGRLLFEGVELELSPGVCLGLVGPNGSGKTTLIKVLTGEIEADAGTIRRAEDLRVAVFSQRRAELDRRQTLAEALCPVGESFFYEGNLVHVRSWAKRFLFGQAQLKVPVGDLSGGEQARILIANLMRQPADVLVLDEPTNDLDIASLEVLERSLASFAGATLLVTHDRFMLDRLSTQVLGLDGRGGWKLLPDLEQVMAWQALRREAGEPGSAGGAKSVAPAASAGKGIGRSKGGVAFEGEVGSPLGEGSAEPSAEGASGTSGTSGGGGVRKRKLSYNEQREWDGMEQAIGKAEAEVGRLEQLLGEPEVLGDRDRMTQCCHDLEKAQAEVSRLYERWAELESLQG